MAKSTHEIKLDEFDNFGNLIDQAIAARVPATARVTVRTESRGGQFDQPPYSTVPVALVFTWER